MFRLLWYLLSIVYCKLTIAEPKHSGQCIATYHPSMVRCPPPTVLPPPRDGYAGMNFSAWIPPPSAHLLGRYYMTYSSLPDIQHLANLWEENYTVIPVSPEHPAGTLAIINSWSNCSVEDVNNNNCDDPSKITTQFGYERPIGARGPSDKRYSAAWNYTFATSEEGSYGSLLAVVAWGYDADGDAYYVLLRTDYEHTAGLQWFNVMSRCEQGPAERTMVDIIRGLRRLGETLNDELWIELVDAIGPVEGDERRKGEGSVECDEACMQNRNY